MQRSVAQPVHSTLRMRFALPLSLAIAAWFGVSGLAQAHWHDDVGYTQLQLLLGDDLPTGQGVFVSQVEAGSGSGYDKYLPDPNHSEFQADSDPLGQAVTFVNGSPIGHPSPEVSNHATNIGRNFYGNPLGMAPAANLVVNYEVNDYAARFLNGAGSAAPDAPTFVDPSDGLTKSYVVQNHSWAGSLGTKNADGVYLRKIDYLIDTYDLTMVAGVFNGDDDPQTPDVPHPNLPYMLGHSYNAIVVGRSDGLNSINSTTLSFYGTGRAKPVIVAGMPGTGLNTASAATAAVSGAAAMFHEVLAGTDGTRSEPLRAILLAGATKSEFVNYVDPATGLLDPWTRSPSQPLDNTFGAGELNVYNSYLITQGGEFDGGTTTPTPIDRYGWDYEIVNASNDRTYQIEIPEGSTATELSVILTWNVDINPTFSGQTLANLNLTLKDSQGSTVDESISGGTGSSCTTNCDNTEHIYVGPGQDVTALGPGTYTLEVSTNLARDYGLAWRMTTLFDQPSADFDENGEVDGDDFLTWQRNAGKLLNAAHAEGDADGDGDIDKDDLAIFDSSYGVLSSPAIGNLNAVPEPGALALVVFSSVLLLLSRRIS